MQVLLHKCIQRLHFLPQEFMVYACMNKILSRQTNKQPLPKMKKQKLAIINAKFAPSASNVHSLKLKYL